jgi:hypothetical protein
MKKTGKYLLLLLAATLAISGLLIIELNRAQTGLVEGEKFSFQMKSNFSNHGLEMNTIFSSRDISDITESNNTVVQYTVGSVNQANHSFDFTDQNRQNYSAQTQTYGNTVFYDNNLNKNDKLYLGTQIYDRSDIPVGLKFVNIMVNDSQTISYPSGPRTINHANYDLGTGYFNSQVNRTLYENVYFDKNTGVATHFERIQIFTDNQNSTQYSILISTWDLTQTNVWTVGSSIQNYVSNP